MANHVQVFHCSIGQHDPVIFRKISFLAECLLDDSVNSVVIF